MSTVIHPGRLNRIIRIVKTVESEPDQDGVVVLSTVAAYLFRAELVANGIANDNEAPGSRNTTTLNFRTNFADIIAVNDTLEYAGTIFQITKLAEIGYRTGLDITVEAID